jgi:hypothetical protein
MMNAGPGYGGLLMPQTKSYPLSMPAWTAEEPGTISRLLQHLTLFLSPSARLPTAGQLACFSCMLRPQAPTSIFL